MRAMRDELCEDVEEISYLNSTEVHWFLDDIIVVFNLIPRDIDWLLEEIASFHLRERLKNFLGCFVPRRCILRIEIFTHEIISVLDESTDVWVLRFKLQELRTRQLSLLPVLVSVHQFKRHLRLIFHLLSVPILQVNRGGRILLRLAYRTQLSPATSTVSSYLQRS